MDVACYWWSCALLWLMPLRIFKKKLLGTQTLFLVPKLKLAAMRIKQAPNSIMHLLTTSIMNGRVNVEYSNKSLTSSPYTYTRVKCFVLKQPEILD